MKMEMFDLSSSLPDLGKVNEISGRINLPSPSITQLINFLKDEDIIDKEDELEFTYVDNN